MLSIVSSLKGGKGMSDSIVHYACVFSNITLTLDLMEVTYSSLIPMGIDCCRDFHWLN